MTYNYLTFDLLYRTYLKTVEVSGGGTSGVLNRGLIKSVLTHIQNDDYYPNIIDKITHLFFSLNKNHCFEDGNKRIAISASAHFMILNGLFPRVPDFIVEMEAISLHLAAGKIDKHLLHEIITAIVNDEYREDEILKLKIINAIADGE